MTGKSTCVYQFHVLFQEDTSENCKLLEITEMVGNQPDIAENQYLSITLF